MPPPSVLILSVLVLYQTMRELVNQIWTVQHFGDGKLAKYMRCLLKATLPMKHEIPLGLIGEISTMVKQLAGVSSQGKLFVLPTNYYL